MARIRRDPEKEGLAREVVEKYAPSSADELQEALRDLLGPMMESMLRAELDAHLGYPSNDKGPKGTPNRRNGSTPKRVRTSAGEVRISVPRDRDATFEPALVPKGSRDVSGLESRVLSMYARGMSQRDIAPAVREAYGFSVSAETVPAITGRVLGEFSAWRDRPLEPVYAFLFVDCMYVSVRRERSAARMAACTVLAYDLAGRKDVLGLWLAESEGKHHWMQVFDELRARGVGDVACVCADGVCGLEEGVRSVFPAARFQRCAVHLARNSCRYVPASEMRAFCADLRAMCGAPSLAAARERLGAPSGRWAAYPGAVAVRGRNFGAVEPLFRCGPAVRRTMHATDAVESVNSSFRKVTKRGSFPDERAVEKLLYLRVLELHGRWGEGCHQSGWSQVLNQLLCDEEVCPRIERYL